MTTDTARHRAVALVRSYYAAFNRGDWAAMTTLLTDDVAHDLNQGPRETGRPAFDAFLARMQRSYRERLEDIVVMADDDGLRAATEYVVHGEYLADDPGLPPANGQRYVLPGGGFFTLRELENGELRIARVSNYYYLEDWVAQVK